MLHYKLVETFLKLENPSKVYDPFCGSGVTVVEALYRGIEVFGSDINPLALLIADVRSCNFNKSVLIEVFDKFIGSFQRLKPDIVEMKNIDFWFKKGVQTQLGKIRKFISGIEDERVKKFFLVAFSQTVRNVSNNKSGEFKRYRRKDVESFNPDVLSEFTKIFYRYLEVVDNLPSQKRSLFIQDVREPISLQDVDMVITSPPYGDSRTTVAYGQFSSFSLDWIRGLNPYGDEDLKIDRKMLGGKKQEIGELPSEILLDTIEKIAQKDKKRAQEVFSFFYDLFIGCKNIYNTLASNATVVFVVGNRRVKEITIPTDIVVSNFFQSFGMELENIYVREISNKRLPSKNSPTNIKGKTSHTMANEFIVVMRKPC